MNNNLNIAVLSCVWGNYKANIRSIDHLNIEGFIFTNCKNNITIHGKSWNIIEKEYFTHTDPYMVPKYYKTQWHKIPELNNYDVIIWIDATVEIISISSIINRDFDIALFKALSGRTSPVVAIDNAFNTNDIRWRNYREGLKKQKELYSGLNWYGNASFFIVKRNESVIKMNNLWFEHNINYSPYCQISLPWACEQTGLNVLLQKWDKKVAIRHGHIGDYNDYYKKTKCNEIDYYNHNIPNNLNRIIKETSERLEGNCMYSTSTTNNLQKRNVVKKYNMNAQDLRNNLYKISKISKNIMEIGCNGGHSNYIFLLGNPKLHIVNFDICSHEYTEPCINYLKNDYNVQLIKGDSLITVPEFNKTIFSAIHIDGGHGEKCAKNDLINCKRLADKNTLIIFDDARGQVIKNILENAIKNLFIKEINYKQYDLSGNTLHRIFNYVF